MTAYLEGKILNYYTMRTHIFLHFHFFIANSSNLFLNTAPAPFVPTFIAHYPMHFSLPNPMYPLNFYQNVRK
jgi:hypothetical protein